MVAWHSTLLFLIMCQWAGYEMTPDLTLTARPCGLGERAEPCNLSDRTPKTSSFGAYAKSN